MMDFFRSSRLLQSMSARPPETRCRTFILTFTLPVFPIFGLFSFLYCALITSTLLAQFVSNRVQSFRSRVHLQLLLTAAILKNT